MSYFLKSDAVTAVQVTADTEQLEYHGTWQTVSRGTWIVIDRTGQVVRFGLSDEYFKSQYVEVDL
jgi:hypothetical protein